MPNARLPRLLPLLIAALACAPDGDPTTAPGGRSTEGPSLARMEYSEWSEPVNLGPVVNSAALDLAPELSNDGLSLYFGSARAGGLGGNDLWVSHRASIDDPWGAPVNLGPVVNSTSNEAGANLSRDGHWLIFTSTRPGTGGNDLYIAWRGDTHDDLAWEAPQNLGAPINTAISEISPSVWGPELYFVRAPAVVNTPADIYMSEMKGNTYSEPVPVTALNTAGHDDGPGIRFDGREIIFASNRAGTLDLWFSMRSGNGQDWEPPQPVEGPINTAFAERRPSLSQDGLALFFDSDRPGGFGSGDLYMSTRTHKKD